MFKTARFLFCLGRRETEVLKPAVGLLCVSLQARHREQALRADQRCSFRKRKTQELLQKLKKCAAFQAQSNEKVLETVWSGLVAQLEERCVSTRK